MIQILGPFLGSTHMSVGETLMNCRCCTLHVLVKGGHYSNAACNAPLHESFLTRHFWMSIVLGMQIDFSFAPCIFVANCRFCNGCLSRMGSSHLVLFRHLIPCRQLDFPTRPFSIQSAHLWSAAEYDGSAGGVVCFHNSLDAGLGSSRRRLAAVSPPSARLGPV